MKALVVIMMIGPILLSGCIDIDTDITTSIGGVFPATDVGFRDAVWSLNGTGGTVQLPPGEIPYDVMLYVKQDNLKIVGIDNLFGKTIFNFTNHTVWYDPSSSVRGYRAVRPGTQNPAPRTADFSMKVMDFDNCRNLHMKDITFTGAAHVRFLVGANANLHLDNVNFVDINRWFTHHTDYGSWSSSLALEAASGTTYVSDILIENCDIIRTTNWGFVPRYRTNDTVFQNITYRNCYAYRCGMPLKGVEIVDWYYINGELIRENNNWQNWSIGFGFPEAYWTPEPYLTSTSVDWLLENCISEENRESGFHSEYRGVLKENVLIKNCKSIKNGQKWSSYNYGYLPSIETYSTGFLNIPDTRYPTLTLEGCQADHNFLYGYRRSGSSSAYIDFMMGCTATGNGIRDYY